MGYIRLGFRVADLVWEQEEGWGVVNFVWGVRDRADPFQ